ncbi:DUF488 domain-containing protein [Arthrobacter castelli]|uniref:DUF488 domain-containing protein n=1 Tax=Arthrobacter castelli TaxID=271431 RepID=UPI00040019E4|nr:DUF488 domain-containing protein [Arthrobacter castelli]
MAVKIKRIYEASASSDGHRVLVDGVWPRGMKKEDATIDDWLKEIAPSKELRQWFGHDPDKFGEFKKEYKKEIRGSEQLDELRRLVEQHGTVTLLYAAKDEEHNQAVVLQQYLS